IQLNGSPVSYDSYSATTAIHYVPLGGAHLRAVDDGGNPILHTITVDLLGTSAADYYYNGNYDGTTITNIHDNGYTAAIDFFTVVPTNTVTSASFGAAMNNHGIAVDGSTAANIGPSTSNPGLSQQALTAAGFGAGATVTVNSGTASQATFTMPSYPAGGNDNVMADGQTIPLPSPVLANNIDLLVLSTCGG